MSNKVPFSSLKLGQWYDSYGFKLIKCERFIDYSEQTWNSICLKSGTLFYTKDDQIVDLIEKPKKFK